MRYVVTLLVLVLGCLAVAAGFDPAQLKSMAAATQALPGQADAAVGFVSELWQIAKAHPVVASTVTAWVAGEHALPFVKKLEANGMAQLLCKIAVAIGRVLLQSRK